MPEVKVRRSFTSAKTMRVSIDDVRLGFDKKGVGRRMLSSGTHRLSWTVIGNATDTYFIEIFEPQGTKAQPGNVDPKHSGTLTGSKDFGGFEFES